MLNALELCDARHGAQHINHGQRMHDTTIGCDDKIGLPPGHLGNDMQALPPGSRLAGKS